MGVSFRHLSNTRYETAQVVFSEQRKYDLAVALYYHDIRLSDVVTPENRLARWPAHISLSAEMAVEAAEVFINEYRRQAVMESGEKSHAP